jgi:hypothetical protein
MVHDTKIYSFDVYLSFYTYYFVISLLIFIVTCTLYKWYLKQFQYFLEFSKPELKSKMMTKSENSSLKKLLRVTDFCFTFSLNLITVTLWWQNDKLIFGTFQCKLVGGIFSWVAALNTVYRPIQSLYFSKLLMSLMYIYSADLVYCLYTSIFFMCYRTPFSYI